MELRTLRYFTTLARSESVSAAAAGVLITQPALSRQMQALERELRLPLFDRTTGRLVLNAAGRELLPWAEGALAAAARVEDVAAALAAGKLDRITIATPATTEADVIAPFVATFGPADPVPSLLDLAGRSDSAALRGGADLVVGGDPRGQRLERMRLCELPVWAYVPPSHPWSTRESVPLAELTDQTVLALDGSFRARRILDDAVREGDLVLAELVECTGPQIAQALAAAGRGVAVLTDDSRFGLVPLKIQGPHGVLTITLASAWSPTHHAADTLHSVASRLREFCRARYERVST